jgi:hypothetical protein
MWTGQIGGRWTFGPSYFDKLAAEGNLHLFAANRHSDSSNYLAILPMEQFGDFMYAQPVMYNKTLHPGLAKFMWFHMLLWACSQPNINWVDLGGGFHGSWRDFLHNRSDPAFAYKWRFVAKKVKDDPKSQTPYYAQRCSCSYKQLVTRLERCKGCGSCGTP